MTTPRVSDELLTRLISIIKNDPGNVSEYVDENIMATLLDLKDARTRIAELEAENTRLRTQLKNTELEMIYLRRELTGR